MSNKREPNLIITSDSNISIPALSSNIDLDGKTFKFFIGDDTHISEFTKTENTVTGNDGSMVVESYYTYAYDNSTRIMDPVELFDALNADLSRFANYAIESHRALKQKYDNHKYEYHLLWVDGVARRFMYIYDNKPGINVLYELIIRCSCFGHDLIEDAHQSYNDINDYGLVEVSEIIRACTSDIRGRTREERMSDEVYNDLRNTEFATFVKLCDRIANVEYSKSTNSKMFQKYKKEYDKFKSKLYTEELKPMFDYLENIFNN
jgi:hypothetical protein